MASSVIVLQPSGARVPSGLTDLDSFRRWARSDDFPEQGRIDYLAGEVDIDMSPEDVTTHGTPKLAVAAGLQRLVVDELDLGLVLTDRSRLSSPQADLSAEPDVLVVLYDSVRAGRVRLIPKAGGLEGRWVEIEGAADLVIECVSDSSAGKDTQGLFDLYYRAGIREYWLVDVRRAADLRFRIHRRGPAGFETVPAGRDGFVASGVLERSFRLTRRERMAGLAVFRLETWPATEPATGPAGS